MENKVIRDKYFQGCASVRLFFRKQGTEYVSENGGTNIQPEDSYIVQYGGFPSYDSGHEAHQFKTLDEALAYWNDIMKIMGLRG